MISERMAEVRANWLTGFREQDRLQSTAHFTRMTLFGASASELQEIAFRTYAANVYTEKEVTG